MQIKSMLHANGKSQQKDDVAALRRKVAEYRDALFRRGWKNQRPKVRLKSRSEMQIFDSLVEWCEEFDEIVGKNQEKKYFDELIAAGIDVNKAVAANKAAMARVR
ncbi:MAG: hypothetical protein N3A66_12365 [Planctomycetota bacterium]|nr:hypothetical protein [Planctomycetota bacterium]